MSKLRDVLRDAHKSLKLGEMTDSGVYATASFCVNGIEYFIDSMEWNIYRVKHGELYPVGCTVSADKNYYLITAIGGSPIKLHRLLAALLLPDGAEKLLSDDYNVNHIIIPCAKCDKEQAWDVNSPRFLEIVTSRQNYDHSRFVRENLLFDVPIAYSDIDFFRGAFKEREIRVRQRAAFVVSAYIGRRYGNREFSSLKNILED